MTQSEISPDVLRHNLTQYYRFCVHGSAYYYKLAKENEENEELNSRYFEEGSKYLDKAIEMKAFLETKQMHPEKTVEEIEKCLSQIILDKPVTVETNSLQPLRMGNGLGDCV